MTAKLINVLAAITLIEMMIALGLGLTFSTVVNSLRTARLIWRALFANYVIVPCLAVALLLAFDAPPMVAAGLLIVAVCAGAPYGPPLTSLAHGNIPSSVSLMLVLAGSSAIAAPLLLGILLPAITGNTTLRVNVPKLVSTLIGTQLLPLCIGILVRSRLPNVAAKLRSPARIVSLLLNLLTLIVVLAVYFPTLSNIRSRGYLGMFCLLLGCIAAGALMTGKAREDLKAMVISTAVRNAGVSLVIATASFPGTAAVTSATAYALFQTVLMAGVALTWGHLSPAAHLVGKSAA